MKLRGSTIVLLAVLACAIAGMDVACADQPDEVKLRRWYVGLQLTGGERDTWDVFGVPGQPPGDVSDSGGGGTFQIGYRFGGRFLLGLQVTGLSFDIPGYPPKMRDISALITGTVLFREQQTLQPFLRGGFGGGGVVQDAPGGYTVALGTAVLAAGGIQVRLSSRFSLEAELGADFKNILEVQDRPDGGPDTDWSVKASQMGWHLSLGMMVWF